MGQPAVNLTPAEVVARWGAAVTVGTLANWRAQGKGPPFIKFGSRVRYPIRQLEQWESAHLRAANDNDTEPETAKS
ncbi:AlpA family transcriptional regulator [Microvirga sp. 17 mud 1-3]|uniref:helix-turn-helix transcriptional regulator n=1 Tax=Microvirga sp. 17 mud 1-3 TaxID=2082949 RepID=UPI000D6A904C|nr:helix-turn-helix domain-containing protein [Microvirga sp. 17 mud 1-3]AWM87340.1 hypothetical protein C4E04_11750 [Microvirga sp. 17 mud 1-3]